MDEPLKLADENSLLPASWTIKAVAIFAVLFGVLTLFSGGQVLFVDGVGRADAGNYVPVVLWFNFIAGFLYIIAGIGLYLWRGWAVDLSMFISVATIAMFALFAVMIWSGVAWEPRTLAAMVLRSGVWLAIAFYAKALWRRGTKTR